MYLKENETISSLQNYYYFFYLYTCYFIQILHPLMLEIAISFLFLNYSVIGKSAESEGTLLNLNLNLSINR